MTASITPHTRYVTEMLSHILQCDFKILVSGIWSPHLEKEKDRVAFDDVTSIKLDCLLGFDIFMLLNEYHSSSVHLNEEPFECGLLHDGIIIGAQ